MLPSTAQIAINRKNSVRVPLSEIKAKRRLNRCIQACVSWCSWRLMSSGAISGIKPEVIESGDSYSLVLNFKFTAPKPQPVVDLDK